MMILRLLVTAMLLYLAVSDVFRRDFLILPPIVCFFLILVCQRGQISVTGLIPGLVFLILHRLSRFAVGGGDVLLLLMMGPVCGLFQTGLACMCALCLTCLAACLTCLWKRNGADMQIPFVPFLLAGFLLTLAAGWEGI